VDSDNTCDTGPSDSSTRPAGLFSPIDEILVELRAGRFIVLVDDEDRENEGDLVCPAELITPEKVNFMLRYGRGTLCVALSRARCEQLGLPPQSPINSTRYGTAFTVTIDAGPHLGVGTGVSAADRARTILHTVAEEAVPEDFIRPGHVNPLIARDGGVLVRAGQTEGSVDLCRLAGLMPAAALIEILNEDGTMARVPQLGEFCRRHGVKMCTIADLIEYRLQRERLVERIATVQLQNEFGTWLLIGYRSHADGLEHVALCMGGVGVTDETDAAAAQQPTLVRVHSECLTGDVFGSMRCECGQQLHAAMQQIAREGRGVLVYLRQEGRGVGLANKLRAYELQDHRGLDTVEANQALGLPVDRRDYGVGAQILRDLGLTHVRILTNNPKKVRRLEVYGLHVVEQLPLEVTPNEVNRRYLEAKKLKLGHTLRNV
jgi:3,4-dihydroxy 2-butanone 4-phosphate synthase/GTP cyclohydrolase II